MKYLGRALIVLAFAIAVTSQWACKTQREWQQVASTVRLGYYQGQTDTDGSFRVGKEFGTDSENYGFTLSFQPLAYLEPPKEVRIVGPEIKPEAVAPPEATTAAHPAAPDGKGVCKTCGQPLPKTP